MRIETLASPGILSNGFTLRREAAKAISAIEITARATPGGKTKGAAALSAFFSDCVTKMAALVDIVAPTVSTRTRTNATTATVVFSEPLSQGVVPALSSITIGARVLSAVTVDGSGNLVVTGVAITAADVITYTQPAVNRLQDAAGNYVATFTGALA